MRARLYCEPEQGPAIVYEVPADGLSLGRHSQNAVVLSDEHASRWHAVVVCKEGKWWAKDLDTRNGTWLDDDRICGEAPLRNGQVIRIGHTVIRFALEPTDSKPTPLARPKPEVNGHSATPGETDSTVLQVDDLTALCDFMATAAGEPDAHVLIRRALHTIHAQTGASVTGFLNLDAADPLPKVVVPELAKVDTHLSRHLTERVQREDQLVWFRPENRQPEDDAESLLMFTEAVCVPLRAGGATLGALHVYKNQKQFSERQVRFCELLAGHLASSLRLLRAHRQLEAENLRLRSRCPEPDKLLGESTSIRQLRQLIDRVARMPTTVLITGETGVGKELVALGLHRQSARRDGPLVVLNCAAIPSSLVEDELFGHRKGGFTGATGDRPGLFEQADDGTLFLDEIGELSLECQAKLLRVIEGKEFRPVGGTDDVRVDVRVIAATHRDLEKAVRDGQFRKDLYFRLCVIRVPVPPLREHAEDIHTLVTHFLDRFAIEFNRKVRLTDAALRRLQDYPWPGNVRQLRSVLECSMAMCDKDVLDAHDIQLLADSPTGGPPTLNLDGLETWAITQALRQTGGQVGTTADVLGISRDTLRYKMRNKGINKDGELGPKP